MGTCFNPGNESFRADTRNEIYLDKTGLLLELNRLVCTSKNCVAVSHARRFGKSQAAGMVDAYYSVGSDSRELFAPFEVSGAPDFEEHLNRYNVIHVDVSSFLDNFDGDVSQRIWGTVYREMSAVYSDLLGKSEPVAAVLQDVYEKSDRQFVIIVDEWDCVVRNMSDRPGLVHSYLQFLHTLFKSEESKGYLALAYITGILPIKKVKDESALNNFREFTMLTSKRLTPYFGFTVDEVRGLCDRYGMEFASVSEWYDGYLIDGLHMFNPNSVYSAMVDRSLESYWKNTSSFEAINDLITLDMEGLKQDVLEMVKGGRVPVNTMTFRNDLSDIRTKDEALTALIHLGYLAYDADMGEAFVPNFEVALAFQSALSRASAASASSWA